MGVKVLKNKLSEYVRLAASGETVLVTDRDTVVAELGPPAPGRAERVQDAELAELVRLGWLTPPVHPRSGVPPRLPMMTTAELMGGIEADRSDP